MDKLSKAARVGAIVKVLIDSPNRMFTLSELAELLGAAKSSLSEDLSIIRATFEKLDLGKLETLAGVSGGVRFIPMRSQLYLENLVRDLCSRLADPSRKVGNGYLFLNDVLNDPQLLYKLAEAIAGKFVLANVDAVVTVETKGIPLALSVARHLGSQLVIARREIIFSEDGIPMPVTRQESTVAEGAMLSVAFESGSHRGVQSMSLPRRSLSQGARVLIVDDFLRAGGTLRGLGDLLAEFSATVVGTVVLIESQKPTNKLVDGYVSIVKLGEADGKTYVLPGNII